MSETANHFAGDLFIQVYENGVLNNAVVGPVDAEAFEIKPDAKKNTIESKAKATAGQARQTYYTPKPATITIKTSDIPPIMLSSAFMGNEVTINQGAGTLTDAAITLPPYPNWAMIGKGNLAQGLTVKEGSTPLAATDYEVNYVLGLIRATAGGAVKEGGEVTITGAYNAITGSRIEGNVKPAIEVQLMLDGKNVIDGTPVQVRVPKASLSPKNGVDFLSEKAIEITLEGELIVVPGEKATFYVDKLKTA